MTKMFLISPGHGKNTPGKRSPDGKLLEWAFNRRLVDRIVKYCDELDIPVTVLDYEETDVPLKERVAKANKYWKNCCYISIHGNAAGNGKWMTARGWSIYTSKGYTNAIGTLIDKKPILSFEAYVANLSNWHIQSNPTDPSPKAKRMYVLCNSHAIFKDEGIVDIVDDKDSVTVLSALSSAGSAKGLQGFVINEAPDFLFIIRD